MLGLGGEGFRALGLGLGFSVFLLMVFGARGVLALSFELSRGFECPFSVWGRSQR